MRRASFTGALALAGATLIGACSGGGGGQAGGPAKVTLVAYSAFVRPDALDEFTSRTGIAVDVVDGGDTGEMVAKAVLTSGRPEGDVMWGIDDPNVRRALDARVFADHALPADLLGALDPQLTGFQPQLTPVDVGDVCVNIDRGWFAGRNVPQPTTLDDLTDARYRDLLVIENPASSAPGLAFLLATIAEYGPDGAPAYWAALRANGVLVVDSWTAAYEGSFSAGGGSGNRPIVVSYATSPPATIIFAADPKPAEPTTASLPATCYRVAEYAGVLRGTAHPDEAGQLLEFLVSADVQAQLPETNFVYPARLGVTLPDVFARFAPRAEHALRLDPAEVAARRAEWIEAFTRAVLR